MTPNERHETSDNRSYQEQLALTLLACLGREGALHACRANAWDGVLDYLLPKEQEA